MVLRDQPKVFNHMTDLGIRSILVSTQDRPRSLLWHAEMSLKTGVRWSPSAAQRVILEHVFRQVRAARVRVAPSTSAPRLAES